MTRIAISARAGRDLERLAAFLSDTQPDQAIATVDLILGAVLILQDHPGMGRPVGRGLRELVVSRGRSGYLALYRFDMHADCATVLAIRHQREAGYAIG